MRGYNGLGGDKAQGGLDKRSDNCINNDGFLLRNMMTGQHIQSLDHGQPPSALDTTDPLGVLTMNFLFQPEPGSDEVS